MASDRNHTYDAPRTTDEFHDLVNITSKELDDWLKIDDSKAVGQKKDGDSGSTGHHMGRETSEILHKKRAYGDEEVAHMLRGTGYINRHLAERPDGDVEETPWR